MHVQTVCTRGLLPAQEPGNEARVQCVLYTEFPTSQNFYEGDVQV